MKNNYIPDPIMMDDAMKVMGKEDTMEVKDIAEIVSDSIEWTV